MSIPNTSVFYCLLPAHILTPEARYRIPNCTRSSPLFTRVDTRSMVEPAAVQDTIVDAGDIGVRGDRDVGVVVTGAVIIARPQPVVAGPVCVVEAKGVCGELLAPTGRHGAAADLCST